MSGTQKMLDENDKSFEIVKDIHSFFLQGMEERYKDILSFLGFVLPALTGFGWLANEYEKGETAKSELTFLVGSIAALGVLLWGGIYSLATSYRYRYLQASVYRIEESTGAAKYIPRSFKPTPVRGFSKRLGISIAPGILQVHVFFFMVTILGVGLAYFAIGKIQIHRATILACSVLSSGIIYLFGAFHYPRKLNALIQDFRESCHIANSPKARCKVFFLTGPSGVGKSTLRDYFCKRDCIEATSAFTTRPKRTGEHEIHRSISSRKFQQMLAKSQLCLIAENHGYNYGYLTADLETPSLSPIFIEVDSDTAVANSAKYGALILRVLPASVEDAQRIIRSQKADGMEDRLADLHRQTTPSFIEERKEAGDVIFINHYDAESLERFAELVETLTTPKTP